VLSLRLREITSPKSARLIRTSHCFVMPSDVKLSKSTPQAEPEPAARGVPGKESTEKNNATMQKPETTQELYLPTKIRGLYISPTIRALPHHIEIAEQQPGATKLRIEWSSSWDETRKASYDRVTIPTLKDAADPSVNCHGKPGARIPGIFVASEEVEKPLLVVWTLEGGTKTGIQIEPVGTVSQQEGNKSEFGGYVMVDK